MHKLISSCWSIEHHQLPNIKGPVYVISILENFSRMLLAFAISERQDTAAYLRVLAKALRNYGAPEAIVTDSGGVFYSKRAMAIYEALDIHKERIDPRQSWQNYIEAHFVIMRLLANYYLNKSSTLDEMKKAHRKFIRDYNCQIHFAHRERQDGWQQYPVMGTSSKSENNRKKKRSHEHLRRMNKRICGRDVFAPLIGEPEAEQVLL
ncbi:MAG TPA: transposase family protein [Ktedonobacteraceae bacterium]|nr:transposase family protein [Ktedonobacteraceae bacterium]